MVWGYYGHNNIGDDLMLDEIVGRVRQADPNATFLVRTHLPLDVPGVEGRRMEAAGRPRLLRLFRTLRTIARCVNASNVVLIGGGTLFLDKGRFNPSIMHLAFAVWVARRRRKPVHLLGAGIDTLSHPATVLFVRYILRRSESVALRDRFSMEYAGRLRARAVLSSDLLYNKDFAQSLRSSKADRTDVVVCVSEYLTSWRSPDLHARFTRQVLEMLRLLSGWQGDDRVVLCPFQAGIGDRDAEYCAQLAKEAGLPNLDVVAITTPDDVAAVFGRARLTISMRFHALVFSSLVGCPFVGISIEAKIRELCSAFGMPFISPEEFAERGPPEELLKQAAALAISDVAVAAELARSSLNFAWLGPLP